MLMLLFLQFCVTSPFYILHFETSDIKKSTIPGILTKVVIATCILSTSYNIYQCNIYIKTVSFYYIVIRYKLNCIKLIAN
ncbi:unnamed protein product [Rotaria socialis]